MTKTQTGNNCSLASHLQNIIEQQPDTIRAKVAKEALGSYSEIYSLKAWFTDLISHGCRCGFIGSLIYYHDTQKFFDKHYKEIEEIREDWEYSVGEPIQIHGDLKNSLAWFAFEETAYQITNDLNMDI